MTAVVIGASAGVGRALAEALASRRKPLLLVASDAEDLDALAAHLRQTHGVEVVTVAVNAGDPATFVARIDEAAAHCGGVDELYFPIGYSRCARRQ